MREVEIENGWPRAAWFSADREGFEIHPFDPGFTAFQDEPSVHARFYPQVVEFVRAHTGARRVVVFDHTIRQRLPAELDAQTVINRPAVLLAHSDYTPKSGPQRVRDILPEEAEALLARRVAFYNVWKPVPARRGTAPRDVRRHHA